MICKFYDNVVFVCTNLKTSVFFFNINFKGGNLTSFAARIQEKKTLWIFDKDLSRRILIYTSTPKSAKMQMTCLLNFRMCVVVVNFSHLFLMLAFFSSIYWGKSIKFYSNILVAFSPGNDFFSEKIKTVTLLRKDDDINSKFNSTHVSLNSVWRNTFCCIKIILYTLFVSLKPTP